MNKQQWLDEKDISNLLTQLGDNRKRRLFALACCRRVEHLLTDQRSKDCLEKLELLIDGKINEQEFDLVRQAAYVSAYFVRPTNPINSAALAGLAASVVMSAAHFYVYDTAAKTAYVAYWNDQSIPRGVAAEKEKAKQIDILKDIYNPFLLNLKFSEQAVSLSEQVYNGDNDARGILSDYLEENNYPEEIYLHLKNSTHYKGCWVIDQILNK